MEKENDGRRLIEQVNDHGEKIDELEYKMSKLIKLLREKDMVAMSGGNPTDIQIPKY
jgi:hypothetical protein